jgi:putative oxidoreductase
MRIFLNSSTPLTAHYTEIGKAFETIERNREMKIVTLIARILLGLIFVVFGLNGFLNFLSMGPLPTGLAGQFIGALVLSHYFWVVAALQIAGGALLLANRFVTLALVLLGPVIVNIICYHVFLNPTGAAPAAVVTVLWLIVFYGKRQNFSGIFVQRT